MPELLGSVSSKLTTNAYVSALKIQVPRHIGSLLLQLVEENVNAVKFKVLGSNDDDNYETLKAETVLAKNASTYETLTDPWLWVDIQVKASVDDAHGRVTVHVSGI